jgi:RNA polymerase sigma-70 factor (ECF subfamily)
VQARASAYRPDFRAIFEEQFTYVWNSLRHFGVSACDLEDLVHEVFSRVHERLDEYDPSRPLRPWLFAFAFRVASAHRRLARHRAEVLGTDVEAPDDGPPADQALMRREDVGLALDALDAIDLDRRAVFVLHELDEVPLPEVARALGIPAGTASSRLRLARRDFQEAIKRLRAARGDR